MGAKEAAHESADGACCDLALPVGGNLDAVAEEDEIDAHQDKSHAEDDVQHSVVHPLQTEDGKGGDDDEGREDGHEPAQFEIAAHPDADDKAVAHRQQPGEGRGLTVGGHEKGKHGHDEHAKTEACGALDETGADAQQEYDDKKMEHHC